MERFEWNHVYDYDAVVRGLKEITFIYTKAKEENCEGLKTLENRF